jgi:hypothetical protein
MHSEIGTSTRVLLSVTGVLEFGVLPVATPTQFLGVLRVLPVVCFHPLSIFLLFLYNPEHSIVKATVPAGTRSGHYLPTPSIVVVQVVTWTVLRVWVHFYATPLSTEFSDKEKFPESIEVKLQMFWYTVTTLPMNCRIACVSSHQNKIESIALCDYRVIGTILERGGRPLNMQQGICQEAELR